MSGEPHYPPQQPAQQAPPPQHYQHPAPHIPPVAKPIYKQTWFIVVAVVTAVILLCCCGGFALSLVSDDDATSPAAHESQTTTAASEPDPSSAVATTSPPKPEKNGPAVVKKGESIEVEDSSAVARVTVTKFNPKVKSNNQFIEPDHGQFAAAWIEIAGVSGESDLGPSNFRLIGPDGSVYNSYWVFEPMDQMMDTSTPVREGQKKSGWVVFDCNPVNLAGSKVEANDDFGNAAGYWQL